MCLLAAKSVPNCDAIDGVFTDVKNGVGFSDESEEALRMGFDGKLTLHPDQVRLLFLAVFLQTLCLLSSGTNTATTTTTTTTTTGTTGYCYYYYYY